MRLFRIRNEKPTDVTVSILFIYRRISTCFGPTGPSSGEFTQLFTQPLVQYLYRSGRVLRMFCGAHDLNGTDTVRNNGCVNSCVNSPEDGPVDPKHLEIRRYMNKMNKETKLRIHNITAKAALKFGSEAWLLKKREE